MHIKWDKIIWLAPDCFDSDCDPYDRRELKLELKAKKKGEREIIVTFTSKEMQDIVGEHLVTVKKK